MIEVSEKAIGEFTKVLGTDENKGLGIKIRASVSQSCCSCGPGQSYEMDLVENGEDGDLKVEKGGIMFYMDEASAELMKGLEVDFVEDHGFVVKDLNAPSCGCGDHHGHDHGHEHGGSCCG